jgi:hypothetical protein
VGKEVPFICGILIGSSPCPVRDGSPRAVKEMTLKKIVPFKGRSKETTVIKNKPTPVRLKI